MTTFQKLLVYQPYILLIDYVTFKKFAWASPSITRLINFIIKMYSWSGKAKDPDSNDEVPSDDVDEFPGWTLHPRRLLTLDLTSHPCQDVDELPSGERQILKVAWWVGLLY